MEKLIKSFKKECYMESKIADILWKIGQLVALFAIGICYWSLKNFIISLTISVLIFFSIYFICEFINTRHISKKLELKYSAKETVFTRNVKGNIYKELDKFQKEWITNYCKENRIDKIQKLKIIREELMKQENNNKYIKPIVIGTLLLSIWDVFVEKSLVTVNDIVFLVIVAIAVAIIIRWIIKEWYEQLKFMNIFREYSGNKRLEELLLYRIIKCNK